MLQSTVMSQPLFQLIDKSSKTTILPKRATAGSVGYDLFMNIPENQFGYHSVPVDPDIRVINEFNVKFFTGVSVKCPYGYYGQILCRSGMANAYGMQIMGGVIDPDYTGEIIVIANFLKKEEGFFIPRAKAIAQLVFIKCWTESDMDLRLPRRYDRGFGSSDFTMTMQTIPYYPTTNHDLPDEDQLTHVYDTTASRPSTPIPSIHLSAVQKEHDEEVETRF